MTTVPFFWRVGLGLAVAALGLQLLVLFQDPVAVQSTSCNLAPGLQAAFPLPKWALDALVVFHKKTSSFVWMQLSSALSFVFNYDEGTEVYLFVVFGHIIKNFIKSFLQSPRGFWMCTEGTAPYCGSGNSMPSGHLMLSIAFFLILYYKRPSQRLLRIILLLQSFIFVEVLYLGTHTLLDNTIGLTFGIFWFCLYRLWKEKRPEESPYYFNAESGLVLFSLLLVYALERLEIHLDDTRVAEYPTEWKVNYERYCGLPEGHAIHKMRNSSAFEKTALLLGVNLGLILRHLIGLSDLNDLDESSAPTGAFGNLSLASRPVKQLARLAIGLGVFSLLEVLINTLYLHFVGSTASTTFKPLYITLTLQPIWTLAIAPTVFHLTKLGTYIEDEEVEPSPISEAPSSSEAETKKDQ